jgi:DNA polymerase-3 subunit delta'
MNNMIYSWQKNQWKNVFQMQQAQRLPHALLLYGAEGTGKSGFARSLAGSLLCQRPADDGFACGHCARCRLVTAGTHPDLSIIVPTPPKNTTSKKPALHIRIDTIRELSSKLSSTSQMEGYRVAVIENADRLVMQASNALLKTLEEPGADTMIILVTSNPHRLPITIRSRCQSIRFNCPDKAEALAWLTGQGIKKAEVALNLAHGAPLVAARYEDEQLQNRELLSKALLATTRGESSLSYAQKLTSLPKDKSLAWLLDWTGDLVRLKRCEQAAVLVNEDFRESMQKLAKKADTKRIFAYYDLICDYIRQDGIALNPQLLWENLLISWENL